jgi:hypothetical protein
MKVSSAGGRSRLSLESIISALVDLLPSKISPSIVPAPAGEGRTRILPRGKSVRSFGNQRRRGDDRDDFH